MSTDEEFAAFVADRYTSLVRAAVLLGCRSSDAEDLVQETLARCYVAWPRVRAADCPDAYVYRVLTNGLRRAARRQWRREIPHGHLTAGLGIEQGSPDPAVAVAVVASVRAALGRLSRAHREVLVLRYFADLTEHQTAVVLRVAPGTVKSRAARALASLARDPALADLSPQLSQHHPVAPATRRAASPVAPQENP